MTTSEQALPSDGAPDRINFEVDGAIDRESDVVQRAIAAVNAGHTVTIAPGQSEKVKPHGVTMANFAAVMTCGMALGTIVTFILPFWPGSELAFYLAFVVGAIVMTFLNIKFDIRYD
ncbi:MAG: hypothetical protein V4463_03970 [Pseudomonadota bacterium]